LEKTSDTGWSITASIVVADGPVRGENKIYISMWKLRWWLGKRMALVNISDWKKITIFL